MKKFLGKVLGNIVALTVLIAVGAFSYQYITGETVELPIDNLKIDKSEVERIIGPFSFDDFKSNVLGIAQDTAQEKTVSLVESEVDNWRESVLGILGSPAGTRDKESVEIEGGVVVALFADSHESWENLEKASVKVFKDHNVDFIIHLGDLSRVGTPEELKKSKTALEKGGGKYYVVPGDHDLWDSVGLDNYRQVFGEPYYSKKVNNWLFLFIDNSDNYVGIGKAQFNWIRAELAREDYDLAILFMHNPLYMPQSARVMGENSPAVKQQGKELIALIREHNVKAVIAGDHHYFSVTKDGEKDGLTHYVVGALTEERNLQKPRYAILELGDEELVVSDVGL